MYQKSMAVLIPVVIMSVILSACAPQVIIETVLVTHVVTEIVEVPSTPEVKEVVKTVIVEAIPAPAEKKLEIFHWWTTPGERQAAEAMFAAFKARNPDVEIVENPGPAGGSIDPRAVLQSRITLGLPPDTFQVLGGAELRSSVDSGILQPLDELYAELGYADVIPEPVLEAVSVGGHPYAVPLNMHIQNMLYYNLKLLNELKIAPPTTSFSYTKPLPLGSGSTRRWTSPNWPAPPDCFLWRYCALAALVTVSR